MNVLDHGIVDCLGFDIVKNLPWDLNDDTIDKHGTNFSVHNNWGIIICRPPGFRSNDESRTKKLYGIIGPVKTGEIRESCLGIPIQDTPDIQGVLLQFGLACGLSIIEKGKIELGDTIIVAGMNLLALFVLIAAREQGANTACLIPGLAKEMTNRLNIERIADEVIEFGNLFSFDAKLDAWSESKAGKTVYIDTDGQPNLVYEMAKRMEKFGNLILCRQEKETSILLNLCDLHHRKSAYYIYWARPETLKDTLQLSQCWQRAENLRWCKRLTMQSSISHTIEYFSQIKK